MPVPVKTNLLALVFNDALNESHNGARTVRRRVSNRVADADGTRARSDRSRVERSDSLRVCARSVFRYIHHGQAFFDCEGNGLFRQLQELVERPVFRVEANRRRAYEGAGFDCDAYALRYFRDGLNVCRVSARRAVWTNAKFLVGNLSRKTLDSSGVRAARTRQPYVRRVNRERVHQVQQLNLL